jgi:hypothetical protein
MFGTKLVRKIKYAVEITKNWGAFHTGRKGNRRTSRPPEPYKTEHECFIPVVLLRYIEMRCCGIFISKPTIGRAARSQIFLVMATIRTRDFPFAYTQVMKSLT